MGKGRRGISLGTGIMLLLTAAVLVACAVFLRTIAGEGMYERTSEFLIRLAEQGSAAQDADSPAPSAPAPEETARRTVQQTPAPSPTPVPEAVTLTLAAAGTVYAPKAVRQSAQENGDHYDFTAMFAGLGDALSQADLAIATLETTTAGQEKGYGNYNTPPQILDALRACGVDLISLATERALDKGYEGLDITLSELTARGLACAGISVDGGNAGTVMNIGGVQVAVLAYTYGLSEEGRQKSQEDERGMVARLETARMTQDIVSARVNGADVVVVLPHWGTKNKRETPDNVRAMARTLAEAGADVILGTHPNVVQGTERLRVTRSDGLTYECLVCYSLGSLLTDARTEENTAGMIAKLEITYDPVARRISLGEMAVTPVYIAREREGSRHVYRVVDAENEEAVSALSAQEQASARSAAQSVRQAAQPG